MAVNPYCIAECFYIFKYKPVCMAVIHDTEPADPFPFYQGVKTFCAGIVPWAGPRLNLMSAAVAVGYMDQGFERKYSGCRRRRFSPPPVWFILLQSHFSRAIRRRMRRGSSETARRGEMYRSKKSICSIQSGGSPCFRPIRYRVSGSSSGHALFISDSSGSFSPSFFRPGTLLSVCLSEQADRVFAAAAGFRELYPKFRS